MRLIPLRRLPESGSTLRGRPLYGICSNEGTFGRRGIDELLRRGRFGRGFMACGEVR